VAEYPWRDKVTGMRPGCEHAGKPLRPMREATTSSRVVTWLPGGISSGLRARIGVYLGCPVESRLGCEPESVCITHGPKIHAPTFKPKESLA